MKKFLFIIMMFLPFFVGARSYNESSSFVSDYMETGDYKFSYFKYIYTPTNNSSFYSNDSNLFIKGGLLSLEEFKITLKNNTRSLYYSYLYEGNPYWTLTKGSISSKRKTIDNGYAEYDVNDFQSHIGMKITEYIIPGSSIIGQGTYNDPFLFAPQYRVLIKVNNSERGVMLDKDGNEITSLEFMATESFYKEIKIKSKGKYGYIGSTCGFVLNDIQASAGKLVFSGATRDTECTINFGEKPSAVILDQSQNNKKVSNPEKLYIIPETGWYSDEFANYSIATLITNPARIGYTFKGYYKSSGVSTACSGTMVIGSDKKLVKDKNLLESFTLTQTLYPCYEANTYTITFDKNTGDSLSTTSKSVVFDQTYGTLPTPSKTGYTFTGWYTDAQYGEKVESSTLMDVEGDHTLYAHWTPNTNTQYTVRHWLQNVGAGATQNATNYTETTSTTHTGTSDSTVNAPRKTFTGFTQPSGQTVTINRFGNSEVNYYYTRNSYTVTFGKNGRGTPSFANKIIQYEANYELPTISAIGYTFDGWYTAASGGTKVTSSTKLTNASNHTLYAHWTINKYTVTLNKGKGITAVTGAGTYDYNSVRNISATVQAGYTWVNWTGYTTTTTKDYAFNLPAQDVTFTANATGNPYAVVYNCNGGSGAPSTSSHIYGTASTVKTNTCTKTGYLFTTWNTSADGSGTSVSSGGSISTLTTTYNGTVTLYAQWTPLTYYISFAANGGSGTMSKMTVLYNQVVNLTANTFTRTGHRFDGWSGSNGTNYNDKASVTKLSTTNGATITMTASWTKCSAGTYLSGNTCTTCPAGKYCLAGTSTASSCPSGYTSSAGATAQSSCYISVSAGKYIASSGTSTQTSCAVGKYRTAHTVYYGNTSSCSSCPSGYTSSGGATAQSSCYISVSAGKYIASSGTSTQTSCAAGKYSTAHTVYYGNTSSCSSCRAGTYSTGGASSCSTCTAGYYCPGNSNRISCAEGYTSNSGATSASNCSAYTCSSGTLTKDSSYGYICVKSSSTSSSTYECGTYECGSYVCGSYVCGSYVCGSYACGSYACGSYACGTEQVPTTVDNCCYRCGGSYNTSYACCSACGTTTTYTTQTKYCTSYCNSYCDSYCDSYCPSYCTSYCTSTSYYCPSGWSDYSGSGSSLKCYKAASY